MACTTTEPASAAKKMTLTQVITMEGNERHASISYFLDEKQLAGGSVGKTVRKWDVLTGKDIEKARNVGEYEVWQ